MKTIFVSGPISSPRAKVRLENIDRGIQVAQLLEKNGFRVICPHRDLYPITALSRQDGLTEAEVLRECFSLIRTMTDAVLFLAGWEDSHGAHLEHAYTTTLNVLKARRGQKPVGMYYDITELIGAQS